MRWAFAVGAALCVVVLGLVTMMPARLDSDSSHDATEEPHDAEEGPAAEGETREECPVGT